MHKLCRQDSKQMLLSRSCRYKYGLIAEPERPPVRQSQETRILGVRRRSARRAEHGFMTRRMGIPLVGGGDSKKAMSYPIVGTSEFSSSATVLNE
jgi:hypothetical protein